jgi:mannose-1-phosphate guanylyltransferase
VGSWASLRRLYSINRNENLVTDQNLMRGGRHLLDQVTGSTVVGSGQIVVIGLQDVIVSSNDGYVLVCAKDKEHHIQAMVDQLEED